MESTVRPKGLPGSPIFRSGRRRTDRRDGTDLPRVRSVHGRVRQTHGGQGGVHLVCVFPRELHGAVADQESVADVRRLIPEPIYRYSAGPRSQDVILYDVEFASTRTQDKGLRLVRLGPRVLGIFAGTIGGREAPGNGPAGFFQTGDGLLGVGKTEWTPEILGGCSLGGVFQNQLAWGGIECDATRGELPQFLDHRQEQTMSRPHCTHAHQIRTIQFSSWMKSPKSASRRSWTSDGNSAKADTASRTGWTSLSTR